MKRNHLQLSLILIWLLFAGVAFVFSLLALREVSNDAAAIRGFYNSEWSKIRESYPSKKASGEEGAAKLDSKTLCNEIYRRIDSKGNPKLKSQMDRILRRGISNEYFCADTWKTDLIKALIDNLVPIFIPIIGIMIVPFLSMNKHSQIARVSWSRSVIVIVLFLFAFVLQMSLFASVIDVNLIDSQPQILEISGLSGIIGLLVGFSFPNAADERLRE